MADAVNVITNPWVVGILNALLYATLTLGATIIGLVIYIWRTREKRTEDENKELRVQLMDGSRIFETLKKYCDDLEHRVIRLEALDTPTRLDVEAIVTRVAESVAKVLQNQFQAEHGKIVEKVDAVEKSLISCSSALNQRMTDMISIYGSRTREEDRS